MHRNIEIWSDFDQVFHDYHFYFKKIIKKTFNIDYVPSDSFFLTFEQWARTVGITPKEMWEVINKCNAIPRWRKTPFADSLVSFLKSNIDYGNSVCIVTARNDRTVSEKIINKIFGEGVVPVYTCKSQNKWRLLSNASIYFEDSPNTVLTCAQKFPHIEIIVPKWPWNKFFDVTRFPNVLLMEHADLSKYLDSRSLSLKH